MLKLACIPAYNEENTIYDVIKKTSEHVDAIIVCDDGSTDNTVSVAESAGALIIKNNQNLGKGAAMKSLFRYAKKLDADIAIFLDGDGQFLPEEIPKLINPILKTNVDIVIGYRFENQKNMPKYREIGNKLLDKITNLASELALRDTQSGFRAYSKNAIDKIQFNSDGFAADSEILIDASNKDLKITEEKVTVLYDTGSKTSTKHPVLHSADVLTPLIELIIIKKPLLYLALPGLILIIFSFIFSGIVIGIFNETRAFSIPTTMIALGSLVIGLMLLPLSAVLYSITKTRKKN